MRQLRKNVTRQVRDAMTFAITLTAVAVFLSAAAIVILAILVAAIRSDDRAKNLTRAPRTRTEQVTRRLLGVGVRTDDRPAPPRAPPSPKAICHDPLDPARHPPRHRNRPDITGRPRPPASILTRPVRRPGAGSPTRPRPASPAVPPDDHSGLWLRNAAAGLGVLAAAAATVSFTAQYRMAEAARHLPVIAALEAAIPDAAALVFASLGIALALHGRRALRARALNLAAVGTSVFMNVLAAAPGWRNLAIWALPPVAYALASDTLIGVVRAWAIARHQQLGTALAADAPTPLTVLGGLALWLLRLALAPASTLAGFRAWVLEECPVAPGRRARPAPPPARSRPGREEDGPAEGDQDRPVPGSWPPNGTGLSPPSRSTPSPRSAPTSPPSLDLHPGAARAALRKAVLAAKNGDPR